MVKMGTIWDRATEFLRDNVGALMSVMLIAIFASTSVSNAVAPLFPSAPWLVAAIYVACAIASRWGQTAVTAFAIDPPAGAQAATRRATKRLLPVVGVLLLYFVALTLLVVPILALLALGGFDFEAAQAGLQPQVDPAYAGGILIYTLVLLPLLLSVAARFSLLAPVITNEPVGLGAFGRSFALTRGITWKLVGVILLYWIVLVVVTLAAQAVFGSLLYFLQGEADGAISIASVLTAIVMSAVATGFTLIQSTFLAKLYVSVADRLETDPFK